MTALLPADGDTIAAIATAAGAGGIGIIRLSGPDSAVVVYYPGPASFTGEDVVELQCHGSSVLLQMILRECLHRGARQAQAGEFSQRAFLNGKIDLLQAEAIADLIAIGSEAASRGALRSLDGEFSQHVNDLLRELIDLRVFVEAAIDFPEEEIDFIADSDVGARLDKLAATVANTLQAACRGRVLRACSTASQRRKRPSSPICPAPRATCCASR